MCAEKPIGNLSRLNQDATHSFTGVSKGLVKIMNDSKDRQHPKKEEKIQELSPKGKKKISQGQPFDEMQRQEKNLDGKPQK